ncbi:MAG TPA: M90 family metallopeptidase [Steroidobacteraceae bacterium]|nr:M90 family metallopeptidase [Steroidobacteraceae bacterium]
MRLALIAGLIALAALAIVMWHHARQRRRRALNEPFPDEWRAYLEASLPLYRRMPRELRLALEPRVRAFLADVRFIGCNGLAVTDEMRLVIALQACLLVSRRGAGAYGSLYSVLVYPDEFVVAERDEDEAGVVTEGERALSGQAMDTDRIVLSWRDVQETGGGDDAYNVVLHEFAHYLDHSVEGAISAAPGRRRRLADWHRVLEHEYEALCDAVERGHDTLIDPYGAEEPAEFFAVATETFFEQPRELEQHHPALYAALRGFYGLHPAGWQAQLPRA